MKAKKQKNRAVRGEWTAQGWPGLEVETQTELHTATIVGVGQLPEIAGAKG